MSTITLSDISLSLYSEEFTASQITHLQKLSPEFKLKTKEDFEPYKGDKSEEEWEKELAKAHAKYDAYMLQETKEINYPHSLYGIDVMELLTNYPFLKFTVTGSREVKIRNEHASLIHDFNKFDDTLKQFKQLITEVRKEDLGTFNKKCNVHIGGSLLMTVNDLMLIEDSCTDELQKHLDDGWRIVACTVQPDGRRPDYVLGRYDPKHECEGMKAKRG